MVEALTTITCCLLVDDLRMFDCILDIGSSMCNAFVQVVMIDSACLTAMERSTPVHDTLCRKKYKFLKKPAMSEGNVAQQIQKKEPGLWILLLQHDASVAAMCLNYIMTLQSWSIFGAVDSQTRSLVRYNPDVWKDFCVDLTQRVICPEFIKLFDVMFKYAKSITISAKQLHLPYLHYGNMWLQWTTPGLYGHFPELFPWENQVLVSDTPIILGVRYEVLIFWGSSNQRFDMGISEFSLEEDVMGYREGIEIPTVVNVSSGAAYPNNIMWEVNGEIVQSVSMVQLPGLQSEATCPQKESAIVGIEVDSLSMKFFWNRQYIDSLTWTESLVSKICDRKFYFMMDPFPRTIVLEPIDASLSTKRHNAAICVE